MLKILKTQSLTGCSKSCPYLYHLIPFLLLHYSGFWYLIQFQLYLSAPVPRHFTPKSIPHWHPKSSHSQESTSLLILTSSLLDLALFTFHSVCETPGAVLTALQAPSTSSQGLATCPRTANRGIWPCKLWLCRVCSVTAWSLVGFEEYLVLKLLGY